MGIYVTAASLGTPEMAAAEGRSSPAAAIKGAAGRKSRASARVAAAAGPACPRLLPPAPGPACPPGTCPPPPPGAQHPPDRSPHPARASLGSPQASRSTSQTVPGAYPEHPPDLSGHFGTSPAWPQAPPSIPRLTQSIPSLFSASLLSPGASSRSPGASHRSSGSLGASPPLAPARSPRPDRVSRSDAQRYGFLLLGPALLQVRGELRAENRGSAGLGAA